MRDDDVEAWASLATVVAGHECQRQAPARWPATLLPRWGAPGEDLAARRPAAASSAHTRSTTMTDDAAPATPNWSFETRQIHAGQAPDAATGARLSH